MKSQYTLTVHRAETPDREDLVLFLFTGNTDLRNQQDSDLPQITGWNFWQLLKDLNLLKTLAAK